MDLNQLYFDHQLLQMQANGSASRNERRDHEFQAGLVAGKIGSRQRALGAAAAKTWEALAIDDSSLASRWTGKGHD